MILIKVPTKWINICKKFAEDSSNSSKKLWMKDGTPDNKIETDIFTGKMGEVAVHLYLKEVGLNINEPDFVIYKGRQKSWDADLMDEDFNYHCKTQSSNSANKYGISWILQCSSTRKDKLFTTDSDRDIFVGSVLDEEKSEVHIYFLGHWQEIRKFGLIEAPRLAYFAESKRSIYFESTLKYPEINRLI